MPEQQATQTIQDAATARALRQHHALLGLFLTPQSPSDVAARADMPPNLTHHHVRKLHDAGLLFIQRRAGGKVYYQLAAREFRVPWPVMSATDESAGNFASLNDLVGSFKRAYERSVSHTGETEEHVYGFSNSGKLPFQPRTTPADRPLESHPTHLDALTLRLPPERYRKLIGDLTALLNDALKDSGPGTAKPCTVAVLGYQGTVNEGEQFDGKISRHTSSFLGAE